MAKLEKLLEFPGSIFDFREFLSKEEVNNMLQLAITQNFQRSVVADTPPNNSKEDTKFNSTYSNSRTSSVSYYNQWSNNFQQSILRLKLSIASLLDVDSLRFEEFQLLKYSAGEKFEPHLDCGLWGSNERLYTVIFYLNTVPEGGETFFPNLQKKISPESGKLVIWKNLDENNNCSELMRHGGLPTIEVDKYILVGWVRQFNLTSSNNIVVTKTNLEMLNSEFILSKEYYNYKNFNVDEVKQLLSSLYSVCTCRVTELDFKKPTKTSKSKYTFKGTDNPILSVHIVVLNGSGTIVFKSGQTKEIKEGELLSIYNNNDTESFNSEFSFINLDSLVIRIFGLHLNKL